MAAIGDPALVRTFGGIVRQEYRAVGINEALSPQADLATEPRWARLSQTFGEDADQAVSLVKAYIQGIQGGGRGVARDGVSAVVKHWVGGAAKDGWDSHNYYGRFAEFKSQNLAYHIKPFRAAFDAGVAGTCRVSSNLGC